MKEYYTINGIPPGEPTQKGSNADPYVADVALPNVELGDYSVPTGWPTNVKFNAPGDVPGPVVQFEDDDQGDVKAGYGFESDNLYEGDWFFFHTDHLGSTSYLTDTAGNVSQFVCYTPYGEVIVDEHLTTYENPFKFSGKELDDITGLYDHGARSRNPISTLWYGVDPLWEKYPDFSPYNYCAGNPVKLVDEDGRDWITATYEGESFIYYDERVHSQEDVKKIYYGDEDRDKYDIKYVGKSGSFTSETLGAFEFNSDGSYTHNGGKVQGEYTMNGVLHVGSSKITMPDEDKPNNNWYGNYLGPDNPVLRDNENKYSYAIPPIDDLDYAAFLHDKEYDAKNASGPLDAFLNWGVVEADWNLVRRCSRVADVHCSRKKRWANMTGTAFFCIITQKEDVKNKVK